MVTARKLVVLSHFCYVPLQVIEMAPPYTWSCEQRDRYIMVSSVEGREFNLYKLARAGVKRRAADLAGERSTLPVRVLYSWNIVSKYSYYYRDTIK